MENLINTLDIETQLRHSKTAITELQKENQELKERVKEDLKIIGHLKTFVDAEVFELIGLDKDILKECEQLLKQTDN